MDNIFTNISEEFTDEYFDSILRTKDLNLERIISRGQVTPPNTWLESDKDEWVILIKGRAKLLLNENSICYDMNPGDHMLIKAGVKHRVEWTDPQEVTFWLALHASKLS